MRMEDIEGQWKQWRQQADVDPAFCDRVMRRIHDETLRGVAWQRRLTEWIGTRPAVQAALFAVGVAAGLARVFWMIHSLLFQGSCFSC